MFVQRSRSTEQNYCMVAFSMHIQLVVGSNPDLVLESSHHVKHLRFSHVPQAWRTVTSEQLVLESQTFTNLFVIQCPPFFSRLSKIVWCCPKIVTLFSNSMLFNATSPFLKFVKALSMKRVWKDCLVLVTHLSGQTCENVANRLVLLRQWTKLLMSKLLENRLTNKFVNLLNPFDVLPGWNHFSLLFKKSWKVENR